VHFEDFPQPEGVPLTEAAAAYVISKNIMRRNLTADQRAMIAADLYAKLPKQRHGGDRKSSSLASDLEKQKSPSADSQKKIVANKANVSFKHVERAAAIQKKDASKAAEVQAGTKTMAQAEQELNPPQPPPQPTPVSNVSREPKPEKNMRGAAA